MEQFQPQPKAVPPVNKQEQSVDFSAATQEMIKSSEFEVEQLSRVPGERVTERAQEIAKLSTSITNTKDQLNDIRISLGMQPTQEDPPSVMSAKARIEKLSTESAEEIPLAEAVIAEVGQVTTTEQVFENELEQKQKMEEIAQIRIDALFNEFRAINSTELQSIILTGKTLLGENYISQTFGVMQPSFAHLLAIAFREGITSVPQIIEIFPEITEPLEEVIMLKEKEIEEKSTVEATQETTSISSSLFLMTVAVSPTKRIREKVSCFIIGNRYSIE
jgi:hypothetical protein